MTTRRDFLSGTATTGIAAATLAAFPESIRKALAIPAHHDTGTIEDVKHVVILMQENRAFNHYFGTLKGVRGFGDRFTVPQPGGRSVWEQLDLSGTPVLPYELDGAKGNAQRVNGTPHGWDDGQFAWLAGRLGYWPAVKTNFSMSYYKPSEVAFQRALANAFTICDDYHCGLHSSTNPNRMFMWAGGNGPAGAGVAVVDNTWDTLNTDTFVNGSGFKWKTVPETLQDAGVTWKVYQNMPDNFTDNPLVGFTAYRQANLDSGKPVYHNVGNNPAYDPSVDSIAPLYKGIANTLPGLAGDENAQLEAFRNDVKNGVLPQVSWVVASATYSEHPGPSSPVQGAWYTQQILDALTAVPEVWSKTVLLINFDENDGFFDHVPSPAAPSFKLDGTPAGKTTLSDDDVAPERFTFGPPPGTSQHAPDGGVFGPGVRVPMYVVSPWSRGGWVNSQTFDHTSVIRFLETRFRVKHPGISPFRRAVCGDLTSAFNFANPNNEPLPTLDGRRTKAEADAIRHDQEVLPQITPPAGRGLPAQETGVRPSRALPYALHASAHVDAASGKVKILFANTGFATAVFHVYDKGSLDKMPARQPVPADLSQVPALLAQYPQPQRYTVEPGKALDDEWIVDDDGQYDLWVLGPNGFHRHFVGDVAKMAARNAPNPEIFVGYDVFGGGVHLQLRNDGGGNAKFTVKSNKIYGPLFAVSSAVSAFGPAPVPPGFGPHPSVVPAGFGAAPGFGFGAPVFGAPGFGFAPKPGFVPGPAFGHGASTSWSVAVRGGRQGELYWNLGVTGFWYDFIVTSDSDAGFSRRFAGRVETGRHSVSDPGMGLADSF